LGDKEKNAISEPLTNAEQINKIIKPINQRRTVQSNEMESKNSNINKPSGGSGSKIEYLSET